MFFSNISIEKPERTWKRRNYFTNVKFQSRFMMRFLAVILAGSAMSGYVMYLMVSRRVEDVYYSSHIRLSTTGQIMLPEMVKANFGTLAVVILAVAVITLLITHKTAGPLYRLGRAAEKISKGDLTGNFRLRTGDDLKGLAASFETMNESLREQFRELKEQAEMINISAAELCSDYSYAVNNNAALGRDFENAKLEELSRLSECMGDRLRNFHLEREG